MVLSGHANVSVVDVLIVGAGPAGLMAANALARAGVSVRIIDKKPSKVTAGHADSIQPRTMEIFQSYGIANRLFKEGTRMTFNAFYDPTPEGGIARSKRMCRIDKSRKEFFPAAQRYSYSIALQQGAVEEIFINSMAKEGVFVERPVQPVALSLTEDEGELEDPEGYPVKIILHELNKQASETEVEYVHAKYMLGSDGAHSWVREQLGFTMDGDQTNYIWGVVDTEVITEFPDIRNRCIIHSLHGSMMIIPREGDLVRFDSQLSEEEAREVVDTKGRVDLNKWDPDRLFELAKKQLHPYKVEFSKEKIDWWTLYQVGQRVASSYSMKERIFIAGDACHTHSPKAGQGMNASMGDTHNLAWKLAYVLRGWADRSLLETYESERRKYAQDLIDFDRLWVTIFSKKPRTEQDKDGVSHEDMQKCFETFNGFSSGSGIRYSQSQITDTMSQDIAQNIIVGMRMPPQVVIRVADARPYNILDILPSDTRFKILVFTGDLSIEKQKQKLEAFVEESTGESGFLTRYGRRGGPDAHWTEVFDILSIMIGTTETADFTSIPTAIRSHWSKVFVDDTTVTGMEGGKAYSSYGVSPDGAIVIVRPDGYVGSLARLENARLLNNYFAGFMKPSPFA